MSEDVRASWDKLQVSSTIQSLSNFLYVWLTKLNLRSNEEMYS